jgi:hypothetical protein
MGLDQYLYARKYYSKYSRGTDKNNYKKLLTMLKVKKYVVPETIGLQDVGVMVKIGQWRKAHQIHSWFVDYCQDEVDDCRETYVTRDQMEELLRLCNEVSKHRGDHEASDAYLPLPLGITYCDSHYKDIDYTIDVITRALTMSQEWDFYYSSSW